jgi:hypothetical protein
MKVCKKSKTLIQNQSPVAREKDQKVFLEIYFHFVFVEIKIIDY